MFQIMMNKILWNLINTGEVRSFINNMIIRTEEEDRYNEVVEEVVKQLVENNLYVKLKEEKMKGILEQSTLKGVKDIQKNLKLANYYQQFIKDFAVIARL